MRKQLKHRIYVTRKQRSKEFQSVTLLVRRCVKATLDAEGVNYPCEVHVLITNDREIQTINKETRGIDRPTDVLSFPSFEFAPGHFKADDSFLDPETGRIFLGDIVVSLERVVEQAEEFGHSRQRELAYLVIHSTLHLLGYDHTDEGVEKARMRRREKEILSRIGIDENE